MTIVGHGIDLVETARIADMMADHGAHFLDRCFTAEEQAMHANHKRRAEHLAGRFAAKEAVLKALGTGLAEGIAWTDVEVVREASGQPRVELHGRAREMALAKKITQWLVSITHTATHAAASVIAVSE